MDKTEVLLEKGNVQFLYELIEEGATQSFGIHVAKLAGLPSEILNRSSQILKRLESEQKKENPLNGLNQLDMFAQQESEEENTLKDALAQADVGIAIGSGTDVAAETADIVLVDSNPKDISNLILFGKATYKKMVQNLAWATGYNVLALPLATGFVPGLMISPAFGAALMSISTVICAVNAQLLKREMK